MGWAVKRRAGRSCTNTPLSLRRPADLNRSDQMFLRQNDDLSKSRQIILIAIPSGQVKKLTLSTELEPSRNKSQYHFLIFHLPFYDSSSHIAFDFE